MKMRGLLPHPGVLRLWVLTFFPTLLAVAAAAPDDPWPQWRGPNRDGVSIETGLLKAWPAAGPKLLWTATNFGSGFSTVSITRDRGYTAGDLGETSFVMAFNLTDGSQVWSAKLGKAGAPGWGGFAGPRATPTVTEDALYTMDQYGTLVCLETTKGTERWRKDLVKDFGGKNPEWGYSESPLVDGGRVVVTPGGSKGTVIALDPKSGATLWQSAEWTDSAHYSSLIVAEIGGVRQYIQLTADHVAGVKAQDGKLLWKAARKGKTAVIPTPIYRDGFLYVTSGYGTGCNGFRITEKEGTFSVEQVYENKAMANHHGGVILVGEYVYGHSDGKGWTCQNFKTGDVKWQVKDNAPGKGALVYADGHFVLRQEDRPGTVALIEATAEGYREKGRFTQPNLSGKKTWPHPVVANGRLYIRDQDVLLCYQVK